MTGSGVRQLERKHCRLLGASCTVDPGSCRSVAVKLLLLPIAFDIQLPMMAAAMQAAQQRMAAKTDCIDLVASLARSSVCHSLAEASDAVAVVEGNMKRPPAVSIEVD